MIHVSQRTKTGIKAAVALAGARRLRASQIADRIGAEISLTKLALADLGREGLITGGACGTGGYGLALPPAEISIGQIVRATAQYATPAAAHYLQEQGDDVEAGLAYVGLLLEDSVFGLLDNYSLAEALCE